MTAASQAIDQIISKSPSGAKVNIKSVAGICIYVSVCCWDEASLFIRDSHLQVLIWGSLFLNTVCHEESAKINSNACWIFRNIINSSVFLSLSLSYHFIIALLLPWQKW